MEFRRDTTCRPARVPRQLGALTQRNPGQSRDASEGRFAREAMLLFHALSAGLVTLPCRGSTMLSPPRATVHATMSVVSSWYDRGTRLSPAADALAVALAERKQVEMTAADAPAEWQQVEIAKVRLLAMCEAAGMGREVNRRAKVRPAIQALEDLNPTPRPLESPELLSGCWRLVFTTSDSILGLPRARPFRPRPGRILQSIGPDLSVVLNEEWVLQGALKNTARARLVPRDDGRTVDVSFDRFSIGWLRIPVPALAVGLRKDARTGRRVPPANPPRNAGVLETTFLDETLRISRGDKGNLFVLVRQGPSRV